MTPIGWPRRQVDCGAWSPVSHFVPRTNRAILLESRDGWIRARTCGPRGRSPPAGVSRPGVFIAQKLLTGHRDIVGGWGDVLQRFLYPRLFIYVWAFGALFLIAQRDASAKPLPGSWRTGLIAGHAR